MTTVRRDDAVVSSDRLQVGYLGRVEYSYIRESLKLEAMGLLAPIKLRCKPLFCFSVPIPLGLSAASDTRRSRLAMGKVRYD